MIGRFTTLNVKPCIGGNSSIPLLYRRINVHALAIEARMCQSKIPFSHRTATVDEAKIYVIIALDALLFFDRATSDNSTAEVVF